MARNWLLCYRAATAPIPNNVGPEQRRKLQDIKAENTEAIIRKFGSLRELAERF